ncbi:MAG: hypothetical protein GJ677_04535 [Rhodobacteraceae bacterium]|nr:hypothetical protein [Paracoccaceae bacterium]
MAFWPSLMPTGRPRRQAGRLLSLENFNDKARTIGLPGMDFVVGIDVGPVTFGNIGSPDRLDFTVVGPAVNVGSRVQDLCKSLGQPCLTTAEVARYNSGALSSIGFHPIRGLQDKQELFVFS